MCTFLDVLQCSEETEFLSDGKNVSMKTLTKASEDPAFNLANGNKKCATRKAASWANDLLKSEMDDEYKENFEVPGGNLAYWLLLLVNTSIENSTVQKSQCGNYLEVGQSTENRTL